LYAVVRDGALGLIPSLSVLWMIQKTSAPGSAEPQLRNACLSVWSVKAELGLRVPGREGPVSFKIWNNKVRSAYKQFTFNQMTLDHPILLSGTRLRDLEG